MPDLSSCKLNQIPDAVFMLMKNSELVSCNLSDNLLKRLPVKFTNVFTTLIGW